MAFHLGDYNICQYRQIAGGVTILSEVLCSLTFGHYLVLLRNKIDRFWDSITLSHPNSDACVKIKPIINSRTFVYNGGIKNVNN